MREIEEAKNAMDDIEATITRINQLTCNFNVDQQTRLDKIEHKLLGLIWYEVLFVIVGAVAIFFFWDYHSSYVDILESMIATIQEQNQKLLEMQTAKLPS